MKIWAAVLMFASAASAQTINPPPGGPGNATSIGGNAIGTPAALAAAAGTPSAATAAAVGAAYAPLYRGLVTTRNSVPDSFSGGGASWESGGTFGYAMSDIPAGSVQITWPNYYVLNSGQNQSEANPGTATIKGAFVLALGTTAISRTSNVVTVVAASATGLTVGAPFFVTNALDTSLNIAYTVSTVSGNTITAAGTGTNSTSSGAILNPIYPCTFSGSTSISVAGLADAVSDVGCNSGLTIPAIPAGTLIGTRFLYQNASGVPFEVATAHGHFASAGTQMASYESFVFGTGTATDLTVGGVLPATQSDLNSYQPIAITAPTSNVAVALIGTSRVKGVQDTISDSTGDVGETARSIGRKFAYTNLAMPGSNCTSYLANSTNRARMYQYVTHGVDEYGYNDIATGATPASIIQCRTAVALLFGKPIFGTTVPPGTTSTDTWVTYTNQTLVTTSGGTFATLNGLIRNGVPGEQAEFDTAYVLDPFNTQKWPITQVPGCGSPNFPGCTGTANLITPDGVHETSVANTLIRNSRVINLDQFMR